MSKQPPSPPYSVMAPHILAARLLYSATFAILPNAASANPTDGRVVTGSATISQIGAARFDINQKIDRNFTTKNHRFEDPKSPTPSVANASHVTVKDAGLAALVAPGVGNSGVIQANLGRMQLSSGTTPTVDFYGDGTFNFALDRQVSGATTSARGMTPASAVTNTGAVITDDGKIFLTANTTKSVIDHAINMNGYVQATSAQVLNGGIVIGASAGGMTAISSNAQNTPVYSVANATPENGGSSNTKSMTVISANSPASPSDQCSPASPCQPPPPPPPPPSNQCSPSAPCPTGLAPAQNVALNQMSNVSSSTPVTTAQSQITQNYYQYAAFGSALTTNAVTLSIVGNTVSAQIQKEDLIADTYYNNDCLATVYAMLASAYSGRTFYANSYTSTNFSVGATPNPNFSMAAGDGAPIITRSSLVTDLSNLETTTYPFVLAGNIIGKISSEPFPHYMLAVGTEPGTRNILALDPLTGQEVTIGLQNGKYVVIDSPNGSNVQNFYVTGFFTVSVGG